MMVVHIKTLMFSDSDVDDELFEGLDLAPVRKKMGLNKDVIKGECYLN